MEEHIKIKLNKKNYITKKTAYQNLTQKSI